MLWIDWVINSFNRYAVKKQYAINADYLLSACVYNFRRNAYKN